MTVLLMWYFIHRLFILFASILYHITWFLPQLYACLKHFCFQILSTMSNVKEQWSPYFESKFSKIEFQTLLQVFIRSKIKLVWLYGGVGRGRGFLNQRMSNFLYAVDSVLVLRMFSLVNVQVMIFIICSLTLNCILTTASDPIYQICIHFFLQQ